MRRATLLVAALLIAAPAWGVTIEELPNGARLVAIQSPSTYASGFAVLVDADPSDEGYLPGLRALLARASLSGVEGTDPRQVLERLQAVSLIGGQVTTFADDDAMVMGVSGPPEIAENALGILSDALLRPSFTQPALDITVILEALLLDRTLHMRSISDMKIRQSGDHPALSLAEGRFAKAGEDLGNGAPCGGFDLDVGVLERQLERVGEPAADARFSDPHQADEGDGAGA